MANRSMLTGLLLPLVGPLLPGCNVLFSQIYAPTEDCKPSGAPEVETRSLGTYSAKIYRLPGSSDGVAFNLNISGFNSDGDMSGAGYSTNTFAGCGYGFLIQSGDWKVLPFGPNHIGHKPGGINNLGQVVTNATSFLSSGYSKVYALENDVERALPTPSSLNLYTVNAINDSGTIAGTVVIPNDPLLQPFSLIPLGNNVTYRLARWSPVGSGWQFEDLGVPELAEGTVVDVIVSGMNADGVIVGTVVSNSFDQLPFKWDSGTWKLLPLGEASGGNANAINDAGTVVGLLFEDPQKAVAWVNDQLVILPPTDPNTFADEAYSINNRGDIVGGPGAFHYHGEAILWRDNQVIKLDSTLPADRDFDLSRAVAINDAGQMLALAQSAPPGSNLGGGGESILVELTPFP